MFGISYEVVRPHFPFTVHIFVGLKSYTVYPYLCILAPSEATEGGV